MERDVLALAPVVGRQTAALPLGSFFGHHGDGGSHSALDAWAWWVWRWLRGRWISAVALLLLAGCLGATLAYQVDANQYHSSGMIDLSPMKATVPTSIRSERGVNNSAYILAQIRYLQSREVLARAAADPRLIRLGWPEGSPGIKALRAAMKVTRHHGGDVVSVELTDNSPHTAQMAVDCVLDAYVQFNLDQQRLAGRKAVAELNRRCEKLTLQIDALGKQIDNAAKAHGGIAAYLSLRESKQKQLEQQARRLAEIESTLGASPAHAPRPAGADDTLDRLEHELAALAADYEQRLERFGPSHPLLQRLKQRMNMHMQVIDELTEQYQLGRGSTLTWQHAATRKAIEQLHRQLAELASTAAKIDPLIEQRTRLTRMRADLLAQREAIELESTMEQSMASMIVSHGHLPGKPSTRSAMQGASLGLLGMLVLLMGLATADRSTRWPDQLVKAATPAELLAVLPRVADADAASQQRMARNVHRMRDRLARHVAEVEHPIVNVSGIEHGDGATTIAMNLACSYAVAGQRVLLIDADPQQRGLTEALGLHSQTGLIHALDGDALPTVIHPTATAGLSAMPVGAGQTLHAHRLAALPMRRLLDQLTGRFDLIIIDSGALANGAAPMAIAECADHCIAVVRKGRSIAAVKRGLHELTYAGGPMTTLVFNAASLADTDYQPRLESVSPTPIWPWGMAPMWPQHAAQPPQSQPLTPAPPQRQRPAA